MKIKIHNIYEGLIKFQIIPMMMLLEERMARLLMARLQMAKDQEERIAVHQVVVVKMHRHLEEMEREKKKVDQVRNIFKFRVTIQY
jgi:hypothetical protein